MLSIQLKTLFHSTIDSLARVFLSSFLKSRFPFIESVTLSVIPSVIYSVYSFTASVILVLSVSQSLSNSKKDSPPYFIDPTIPRMSRHIISFVYPQVYVERSFEKRFRLNKNDSPSSIACNPRAGPRIQHYEKNIRRGLSETF